MYIRLFKSWGWRHYSKTCIKKQKYTVSPTLSVSAVVHFYSFSTVHIKDQEKKTNEYDQEIPQSHTADQDQA